MMGRWNWVSVAITLAMGLATGSCPKTQDCVTRDGEAVITFRIGSEYLRILAANRTFVREARALLESGKTMIPMFVRLHDGRGCDPNWTWHPDPEELQFVVVAMELCDGLPSHVEKNKDYWLSRVKSFCPWNARVYRVEEVR